MTAPLRDFLGRVLPTTDTEVATDVENVALAQPGPALAFAGVLATLRRGVRSTCIGVVGDSTGDDRDPAAGGAQVDEWPRVLVRQLGAAFPAYTVQERQWNDTTQGYDPAITHQTGTGSGERRAIFVKTTPGQFTYNGTAVTGDLDVQVRLSATNWSDAAGQVFVARWEGTGNQRSWVFQLNGGGTLGLNWSTDGTTSVGMKTSTVSLPAAGITNGTVVWVRATLDVDNGATGNTVTFYTSPDGITWTQLGVAVVTAGVTSVFAGTANYMAGSFSAALSTPLNGDIYRLRVFPGIGGQQSVVPPLLDDWEQASAETTVSFAGPPVLTLLNGSQSGQNVAYFDTAGRRPIIHQRHGQAVVMISTSHNDGVQNRQTWLAAYNTMVTNIKALLPFVPVLVVAQNAVGTGGAFSITAQGRELRLSRQAILQQWAASQAGVHMFDPFPLLTVADTSDQLHPSTGPGSGSDKWGRGLYQRINP